MRAEASGSAGRGERIVGRTSGRGTRRMWDTVLLSWTPGLGGFPLNPATPCPPRGQLDVKWRPPRHSPFSCQPLNEPNCAPIDYKTLPCDELRQLCRRRGYGRQVSKSVLQPRLSTIDAQDRKHVRDTQDAPSGKRLGQLHVARDPALIRALKEAWGISLDSSLEGVDAAASAQTADRRNKNTGQETLPL